MYGVRWNWSPGAIGVLVIVLFSVGALIYAARSK